FVGLFMGLGNSFAVLVIAEMLGVKAGLGWYLQWAQGGAAYANMYAALLIMALIFSGLITVLFRLRDLTLAWQKGLVGWRPTRHERKLRFGPVSRRSGERRCGFAR